MFSWQKIYCQANILPIQKGQKMEKENKKETERGCGRECLDCPIKNDDNIQ